MPGMLCFLEILVVDVINYNQSFASAADGGINSDMRLSVPQSAYGRWALTKGGGFGKDSGSEIPDNREDTDTWASARTPFQCRVGIHHRLRTQLYCLSVAAASSQDYF
ncbi:hypothetical protein ZHAS_00008291 [Anopheles sinensis]|uniref:Uncharacterized protein n=1 Tax=Anopheles sinensis TaxID=74873 RepID=A0A084VRS9_ANOSI|nr:hypothetical protein ZHAS_00008291 [Anopheles sinensis]